MTSRSALVYTTSFLAGVANTMLSPLLPVLEKRWHLDDASGGLLFLVQFLASVATAASVGWLARRHGYLSLLAPGLLLVAAGVAGLSAAGWPTALFFVAAYGLGLGLLIPAGNLGMAALHPGSSARVLTLLNLSWCAGAVLAPVFVLLLPYWFLPLLAAAAVPLAAACFAVLRDAGRQQKIKTASARGAVTLLVAAMLFLYVGSEASIAGWMPSRGLRGFGGNPLWTALPSAFWIAMMAGRCLTPALLRRVRVHALVAGSLAAALVSAVFIIFAPGANWLLAGGVLAGLALSPVFPLTISQYAEAEGQGHASGIVFVLASLGGAVIPPLIGLVSARSGDLRSGISLILLSLSLLLWLQFRLSRALRRIHSA